MKIRHFNAPPLGADDKIGVEAQERKPRAVQVTSAEKKHGVWSVNKVLSHPLQGFTLRQGKLKELHFSYLSQYLV